MAPVTSHRDADLSWLAIGIATLAYYLLGALWFTPLFGAAWDTAIGHTRVRGREVLRRVLRGAAGQQPAGHGRDGRPRRARPGSSGSTDALVLGLVVGLGVALAVSVNNALTPHTPHPFRLGFITGGYHVVGIVAVTLIVAVAPNRP